MIQGPETESQRRLFETYGLFHRNGRIEFDLTELHENGHGRWSWFSIVKGEEGRPHNLVVPAWMFDAAGANQAHQISILCRLLERVNDYCWLTGLSYRRPDNLSELSGLWHSRELVKGPQNEEKGPEIVFELLQVAAESEF